MNDKDEEMLSVVLRRVRDRERESRQSYNCVANRLFHICPQEGSIDQQKELRRGHPRFAKSSLDLFKGPIPTNTHYSTLVL